MAVSYVERRYTYLYYFTSAEFISPLTDNNSFNTDDALLCPRFAPITWARKGRLCRIQTQWAMCRAERSTPRMRRGMPCSRFLQFYSTIDMSSAFMCRHKHLLPLYKVIIYHRGRSGRVMLSLPQHYTCNTFFSINYIYFEFFLSDTPLHLFTSYVTKFSRNTCYHCTITGTSFLYLCYYSSVGGFSTFAWLARVSTRMARIASVFIAYLRTRRQMYLRHVPEEPSYASDASKRFDWR